LIYACKSVNNASPDPLGEPGLLIDSLIQKKTAGEEVDVTAVYRLLLTDNLVCHLNSLYRTSLMTIPALQEIKTSVVAANIVNACLKDGKSLGIVFYF
jgi:hypothetical protein